jgi:hypothetical protein
MDLSRSRIEGSIYKGGELADRMGDSHPLNNDLELQFLV